MEPCARPVVTGRCILHGRVRASRFPWRVRAAFMTVPDGSRVQCGDWRCQPRLPVRFRAGILRASLMRPRSAGFRNGVRRASGAPDAGSSSSHAVGAPVNTPSRARDGAAHPPSSGMSSLSRRVRLLPQSAGVTADDAFPAFAGLTPVSGVVRRIMRQGARVAPCALPSETGGAGRCAHRICGAGAPHRHAATGLRRDAGWEHPACRRPIRNGWWHTPVRGRPADGPLV